ncbi:MAG: AraC family transcriptional regulator [Chloroflexales bacterium]|nr:AraC family transcriptional regulator [Chloroflexales bacterium]
MDVLSDALRVVRLAGALFFTARFTAPWSAVSPAREGYQRLLHTRADHLTIFHLIVSGGCWAARPGQPAIPLTPGDVIIFPHADLHLLRSQAEALPEADITARVLGFLQSAPPDGHLPQLADGWGGVATHFLCGYLQCDQRFNPLLGALPPTLLVRVGARAEPLEAATAAALPPWCVVRADAGGWLETTLQHTIAEAEREQAGSAAMLPRLTELLFVEVVRRYMLQLPAAETGWLAGVRDPVVGCALQLMHRQPERPWTVEELARAANLSRSALAQRFSALLAKLARSAIGEPPMQYLQGWRMQLAQSLLSVTTLSMRQIAERTGYHSEDAFNRAFKRAIGQPPATWRRQRQEVRTVNGLSDG